MHGQQVNQSLREPQEVDLVVHHLRPVRLLPLARGIVKENEVEVRGVTKLHAAEFAVARNADPHGALALLVLAARLAVLRGRVPECERERLLEDQLGYVRKSVAHLHERQPASEIQHRHAKHRCPPELAKRIHAQLLVVARVFEPGREFLRELSAVRQGLEHACVEQLVEQERMRGDLAGEIVAQAADLHEPAERLCILVQEREVRRAPAYRLDDAQEPRKDELALARRACVHLRDGHEDPRQQGRETAPPELVESAEVGGLPELEQHAGRRFGFGEIEAGGLFRDALERGFRGPERPALRRARRFRRAAAAKKRAVELRGDGAPRLLRARR